MLTISHYKNNIYAAPAANPVFGKKKSNTGETSNSENVFSRSALISSAITAAVAGGLLYKKHGIKSSVMNTHNADGLKNILYAKVEKQKNDFYFNEFEPEVLRSHIDDAMKLPEKERFERLKNINEMTTEGADRGLRFAILTGTKHYGFNRYIQTLPEEVRTPVAAKDQYEAVKAYTNYWDKQFIPAATKELSTENAIKKVLGNDSKIKPHDYDLSKEADCIATRQYSAMFGYKNVTVTSENMIVPDRNWTNTVVSRSVDVPKGTNAVITQGKYKGKPEVTLSYRSADAAKNGTDMTNSITLLSPGDKLTPAQKDLLKLKKSAKSMDIKPYQKITDCCDYAVKEADMSKNTNFDVILSLIHDSASSIIG